MVASPADWPRRRAEVLELFRANVFGRSPGTPERLRFEVVQTDEHAMGGAATLKRVTVHSGQGTREHAFTFTLFLPNARRTERVPTLLFINNREASHIDPTRATRSAFWTAEEMIARGYGAAAMQYGDLAPDDPATFRNGVLRLFDGGAATAGDATDRPADGWGAIGAWAWGASRVMDYLQTDPRVDGTRVAVIGHSRAGKTALWTAAQDERFAAAYSNNSGCGGAAIGRRKFGETVQVITTKFPHWFAPAFSTFGGREEAMPIDQHELLALAAPRLLYVTSATEDRWADPKGEFLSLVHSSDVFGLWGDAPITEADRPGPDSPRVWGRRGYHLRTGKHDLTAYDWARFMDFLDGAWGQGSATGR